jgi:hypothetical protein
MGENFEPKKPNVGYNRRSTTISLNNPARREVRADCKVISAYELMFVGALIALYFWAG